MFYISEKQNMAKKLFYKFVVFLINHACVYLFMHYISFYYAFVFLFIYKIFIYMSKKLFSFLFIKAFMNVVPIFIFINKLIYFHLIYFHLICINFQFFYQIMYLLLCFI